MDNYDSVRQVPFYHRSHDWNGVQAYEVCIVVRLKREASYGENPGTVQRVLVGASDTRARDHPNTFYLCVEESVF